MTIHDDLLNELNQHREQTSEVLANWQTKRDDQRDRPSGVARRQVKTSEVLAINGARARVGPKSNPPLPFILKGVNE